jgi:hypothetical protein
VWLLGKELTGMDQYDHGGMGVFAVVDGRLRN